MAEISFLDRRITTSDDSWVEFSVCHTGGIHTLQMCYATRYSRPCWIRVAEQEMRVAVACGVTPNDDNPRWFDDEGTFDLGSNAGTTTIGFKAITEGWPNIVAFRFVPERRGDIKSRALFESDERTDDPGTRWRKSPNAVTFTFEIGLSSETMAGEDNVEYVSTYLGGKAVKFIFGEAHDTITIDGDPIGDQHGGDNFPKVTFIDEQDLISSISLGLSSYNAEGAFTALTLERPGGKGEVKRPLVGAKLMNPTWTYDRRRLGLNLWITSLCAPMNKPVSRYGFTLSSDDELSFHVTEFERFWDWLVRIKFNMIQIDKNRVELETVRKRMEPLHHFLVASFACKPDDPMSWEGYLYGTCRHVSITFDVFSVFIYRLPDGESFQSTLFVDGKQFDSERVRWEDVNLNRNDILAFAISIALQDTDLLYQMGLIRPSPHELEDVVEIELLPLRKDAGPFHGDYNTTIMARRVITILALAGLRKVSYDTVMEDPDGWDIYDIAAGDIVAHKHGAHYWIRLSAIVSFLIQVVLPILIVYRGVTGQWREENLAWDVYLARLFFGLYFIFFEAKTWDIDNGDRVTGWLCYLPEFSTRKLIVGMLINKISLLVVSVAVIVLMLRTYTVADVALNALALYFILEVDDNLVDVRLLEKARLYQMDEFLIIKSKTTLEYRMPWFLDEDLPQIRDAYFIIASHWFSTLAITVVSVGCIWMFVEPWLLGWDAK